MKTPEQVVATKKKNQLYLDGLIVKDATKPLKIIIEPDDIKKATRKNARGCAAVHSICRMDNTVKEAIVQRSRIYILHEGQEYWLRYVNPQPLSNETLAFDRGGEVQTGEFTAKPFNPSKRLGVTQKRYNENDRKDREPRGKIIRKRVKGVRANLKIKNAA